MNSTGGFTSRAERKSLEFRTTVPSNVGPGSYNVLAGPSSPTARAPAPAPFLSSMDRNVVENNTTSAVTPGPGAYMSAQALDAAQLRKPEPQNCSAAFASASARLHTDKSHMWQPGPGTYKADPSWVKRDHHFSAPPPKQRVNFNRTASAPSIPARDQSYGYEEGPQGMLIMQRPTDPIHSGVGRDTVGPGEYDLVNSARPQPHAVQWSASHTRRGLIIKNDIPGPGSYNPPKDTRPGAGGIVVSINGVDVQFGGAAGSSAFASKTPINSQRRVQEWEKTPGPGAYDLVRPLGPQPLPKQLQFFGTSSRRGSEIDPMRSLQAPTFYRNPGPGAYNTPVKGVTVTQQSLTDPRPFNATSQRFGSGDNGIPGPGEYRPDMSVNLAKSVNDRIAISKGGVFGTNAPRFLSKELQTASKMPGPGNYTARVEATKPVHKGSDAAFASRTNRFRAQSAPTAIDTSDLDPESGQGLVRGDPAGLGPGSYTLPDNWSKKPRAYRRAAFGTDAGRPPVAAPNSLNTPGPGRYNAAKDINKVFKPLTIPSKESVFGSQVSRFKGGTSIAPGPGHYNLSGDLGKRSYNITYTGVAVA